MIKTKKTLQPIDKLAITLIIIFSFMMAILVGGEKFCNENECWIVTLPKVREFTWHNKEIGSEDRAFILTFDRPMEHETVEENLVISPPLLGKFSWVGRRMAYTLDTSAPYGETYKISLQDATEKFRGQEGEGKVMKAFKSEFTTRDRGFAYIGVEKEELGRLVLYNWSKEKKIILTPPHLVVSNFKIYPKNEKILFAGATKGSQDLQDTQLFTIDLPDDLESYSLEKNNLTLVVNNNDYKNLDFDLSADGKNIVVQRLNRKKPDDFGLWLLEKGKEITPINDSQGGQFLIAPDSETLAMVKGEGVALLPLKEETEVLDFLPKFGSVLNFSADGTAAAMINFNSQNAELRYIRSLFWVNNQGVQKKLLDTNGSILGCEFNPNGKKLYCLLTRLLTGDEYQEQPYLAEIDIENSQVNPLLQLPKYQDIRFNVAPDGIGLLFDQVITSNNIEAADILRTNSGEIIVDSRLWLYVTEPVISSPVSPSQYSILPLNGIRPQWLK
jgi:hypothetical protein